MKVPFFIRVDVKCRRPIQPKDIADKVHRLEYANYPLIIEQWILGKLIVNC